MRCKRVCICFFRRVFMVLQYTPWGYLCKVTSSSTIGMRSALLKATENNHDGIWRKLRAHERRGILRRHHVARDRDRSGSRRCLALATHLKEVIGGRDPLPNVMDNNTRIPPGRERPGGIRLRDRTRVREY